MQFILQHCSVLWNRMGSLKVAGVGETATPTELSPPTEPSPPMDLSTSAVLKSLASVLPALVHTLCDFISTCVPDLSNPPLWCPKAQATEMYESANFASVPGPERWELKSGVSVLCLLWVSHSLHGLCC